MKATEQQKAQFREYYQKNKERILEQHKLYSQEHKAEISENKRLYYQKNKEKLLASPSRAKAGKKYRLSHREQGIARSKKWQQNHRKQALAHGKKSREKVKREVISHYSQDKSCCQKCGLNDMRALTIDHIEGGGNRHKKEIKKTYIYYWLREHNYPIGYQVLCMSCQFIKRAERREYGIPSKKTTTRSNN